MFNRMKNPIKTNVMKYMGPNTGKLALSETKSKSPRIILNNVNLKLFNFSLKKVIFLKRNC